MGIRSIGTAPGYHYKSLLYKFPPITVRQISAYPLQNSVVHTVLRIRIFIFRSRIRILQIGRFREKYFDQDPAIQI